MTNSSINQFRCFPFLALQSRDLPADADPAGLTAERPRAALVKAAPVSGPSLVGFSINLLKNSPFSFLWNLAERKPNFTVPLCVWEFLKYIIKTYANKNCCVVHNSVCPKLETLWSAYSINQHLLDNAVYWGKPISINMGERKAVP